MFVNTNLLPIPCIFLDDISGLKHSDGVSSSVTVENQASSEPRLAADLRRPSTHTWVFVSICVMSFLINYGRVAFAPLVDYFIQSGIAPGVAGLTATAVWFGSAMLRLPTGWLLTFLRRYQVLVGVGIALAIGAFFTAGAPGIWLIILGAFIIGLATGGFFIAANPLVSEIYSQDVGIALGLRGFFSQLAAVAAPFLVGASIWLGSWRLGFVALALIVLVVTGILYRAAIRADIPDAGKDDRDLIGGIKAEWQLIATGIALLGFSGFVWQGVFNFYITYLGAEKAISPGLASVILTIMFAAGLPSFLIGGRLADRFSALWVLLTILVAFCISLMAVTFADGLFMIVLLSIILGFIVHGLFPVGDAYLLGSLPDNHRASAYAGYSAVMMFIHAPGSVAVGALAQFGVSYSSVFQGFALSLGAMTFLLWYFALIGRLPGSDR